MVDLIVVAVPSIIRSEDGPPLSFRSVFDDWCDSVDRDLQSRRAAIRVFMLISTVVGTDRYARRCLLEL